MVIPNQNETEAGTRASFGESRVVETSFFQVPPVPETNRSAAGLNSSGMAFTAGVGVKPRRTPRKAPTSFRAAETSQQETAAPPPPLHEKQPSEAPQFFVFKAADEQPRRTPGMRKAKARTAATPFSAATAAATDFASGGAVRGAPSSASGGLNTQEDDMAWSPSNTAETTTTTTEQQKQQPPLSSFLFGGRAEKTTSNLSVGRDHNLSGVAKEFTTRLKVDEDEQQKQPPVVNPFAAAAANPPVPPFTFQAGSPQSPVRGGVEGVRSRRRGTPHRPAPPAAPVFPSTGPPSPPAFVFQAKMEAAAATVKEATAMPQEEEEEGKQQQQPTEGFISLSQFKGTPGAPLRRRPRTKTKPATPGATTTTTSPAAAARAPPPSAQPPSANNNLQWNAPAATVNGGTAAAPRQQYQQHHQHPGLPGKQAFGYQQQKPVLTVEQQAQAASATADKYRIAGNDFFRKQQYEEAFKHYTQALNTLMPYPTVHSQLSLLLSNRAAAALALSRPLQAIQDCRMGLHHDRNFLKCATRMATCHCRLGEYAQAQEVLLQIRKGLKVFDAAGLKELEDKEIEVKESMSMMIDMFTALGYSEIQRAIAQITETPLAPLAKEEEKVETMKKILSSLPQPPHPAPKRASLEQCFKHLQTHGNYFPHSEMFHAAKSETLLRLGRFKEALTAVSQPPYVDVPASKADAPWRTWIRTQIEFYQGQAPQTLELLDTVEKIQINIGSSGGGSSGVQNKNLQHPLEDLDSIVPLPTIEDIQSIRTIIKKSEELREIGNKYVKAGNYQQAIDSYTEALSSGALSPALAAILYSNRAAAQQGLGNIALAVADCCRAKALFPGYAKAHSRLAALLSELGMYSSVVDELNAAISSQDITPTSRAEYQNRLRAAKEAAAPKRTFYGTAMNPPPANHYKVLGLERGCTADQVRKVYKKLALQLHPDKSTSACRVSFRICSSESGSELTEVAAEVQKRLDHGASWVFKCLGEANETLSAPEKRRELDAELSAWEEASRSGGGGYGGRRGDPFTDFGFGGAPSYHYYSPSRQQQHQHSGYSAYGAYYRPHAQPSYNFNRERQYGGGGGSAGASGSGNFRHYW